MIGLALNVSIMFYFSETDRQKEGGREGGREEKRGRRKEEEWKKEEPEGDGRRESVKKGSAKESLSPFQL